MCGKRPLYIIEQQQQQQQHCSFILVQQKDDGGTIPVDATIQIMYVYTALLVHTNHHIIAHPHFSNTKQYFRTYSVPGTYTATMTI